MYLIVFVSKISAGGTRLLEVRRAPLVSWAVRTTRSKGFLHSRPKPVSSDFLDVGTWPSQSVFSVFKLRCSSCFRNIYMYLVVEFLKELHWSFDSLIYIYFKFSEVLSKHAQQLFARERAVEITAGLDDACCFDFVCGNSILSQILLTATHYKSS